MAKITTIKNISKALFQLLHRFSKYIGYKRAWRKAISVSFIVFCIAITSSDRWVYAQVLSDFSASPNIQRQLPIAKPALTVQNALLEVCQARGYGEECGKTLLGMLWKESQNVSTAVGDRGLALGYFQIHYKMHGVTISCATNIACSANWTLDYLESNGYPTYAAYAIQCHNGCNINNGYSSSVRRLGRAMWGEGLPLTVALAK